MTRARAALTGGLTRLAATLRTAPGTLIYLFTLLVTQLTLSTVDDHLGHKLVISESTNLFNMQRVPVQVLVASAFWIDGRAVVTAVTLLALLAVLVTLERWVGTARWLAAIATGHIGATLLTLVATTCLLRHGLLSPEVAKDSDVGVSYVVLTAVGLLIHAIRSRTLRLATAVVAIAAVAVELVSDLEIFALGHLLSLLIGLALFPLIPTARRAGRSRLTGAETAARAASAPSTTGSSVIGEPTPKRSGELPCRPAHDRTADPRGHRTADLRGDRTDDRVTSGTMNKREAPSGAVTTSEGQVRLATSEKS